MELYKDTPVHTFTTLKQWLAWLEKHHDSSNGIWIKIAKKNTGVQTISYEEAREGALIYGWIDGLVNKYDDTYYLQRLTPRRVRSQWSNINRELVEGYIKEGRMKPAGMAQVEAAKADGRWENAYFGQALMTVPQDFQAALNKNPRAKAKFETCSKSARYAFLYQINEAKRPETRERRIQKFVAMLAEGKTLYD